MLGVWKRSKVFNEEFHFFISIDYRKVIPLFRVWNLDDFWFGLFILLGVAWGFF